MTVAELYIYARLHSFQRFTTLLPSSPSVRLKHAKHCNRHNRASISPCCKILTHFPPRCPPHPSPRGPPRLPRPPKRSRASGEKRPLRLLHQLPLPTQPPLAAPRTLHPAPPRPPTSPLLLCRHPTSYARPDQPLPTQPPPAPKGPKSESAPRSPQLHLLPSFEGIFAFPPSTSAAPVHK